MEQARQRAEFLAHLLHELRTPLTNIFSPCRGWKRRPPDSFSSSCKIRIPFRCWNT
ncbi:MAG: histidine kinase dimerization/phospho-acceptor domain-containing protein [Bacillota bacterium]